MKLDIYQTQIVEYSMALEQKSKEYQKLCEELDKLDETTSDPNDERYLELRGKFRQINSDVSKIKSLIEQVKAERISHEQKMQEEKPKYDIQKVFEGRTNTINNGECLQLVKFKKKQSIFDRVFNKIRELFLRI